jgi:hypothetical protein
MQSKYMKLRLNEGILMVRAVLLFSIAMFLGGEAVADPAKRALSVRIPFGGNSEESRPILDLFEINKTLERVREYREPTERATIVLSRDELEDAKRQEREFRAEDDPNMRIRDITVGPETLRGELRPTDVNDLYSNRIRAKGTAPSNVVGPTEKPASPVTLRRSGDR